MNAEREPIGPPPRRPSTNVQDLLAANRIRPLQPLTDPTSKGERPSEQHQPASDSASTAESNEGKARPRQITFYMSTEDRQRAKAAYQATSGVERDISWSAFITQAVMTEVIRREEVHNNGERFAGGTHNLTPGRKLAP